MHRNFASIDLRMELMRNGASQQPAPFSERQVMAGNGGRLAGMDTSGIGQASTTARSSRTYTGGAITPQIYGRQQPSNVEDQLVSAGMTMNARSALPNRGLSPLARRN